MTKCQIALVIYDDKNKTAQSYFSSGFMESKSKNVNNCIFNTESNTSEVGKPIQSMNLSEPKNMVG